MQTQLLKSLILQVLSYSVACVSVSAFSAGIVSADEAEEHMNKLRTLTEQNQQVSSHCVYLIRYLCIHVFLFSIL